MRETVHLQAGQCDNQTGAKESILPQNKIKFYFKFCLGNLRQADDLFTSTEKMFS